MSILKRSASRCLRFLKGTYLAMATSGMNAKLASRDAQRGKDGRQWFTADEATAADALATIIVPSDEKSPGFEDVGVLDPPGIVALDRLVAASWYSQFLYSRGLFALHIVAIKKHKRGFAELSKLEQTRLLETAQQVYESWSSPSALKRGLHKVRSVVQARNGWYFVAQLYPQIRNDCIQVFYTSHVCWTWLGYDGPPMDEGYPHLTPRR